MTPVTDPSLIQQLESAPSDSGPGQPVTDPKLLAQLEGTSPPPMGGPSFLKFATAKPKAALSLFENVANQISPTAKIQRGLNKTGDWIAEKGGAAGVNPYVAAGAGTLVSRFPAFLAAYTALPQNVTTGIETGAQNVGKSIFNKLGSETGGAGGELPPTPSSPPPAPAPEPIDPNYLQRVGGSGMNAQMGIRGSTVQKLTRAGQNPGKVGISLAKDLQEAGATASNPIDAWDKFHGVLQSAGQDVGNAKTAIANEAVKYGAVENPLEMDAPTALKPLTDMIAKTASNKTGVGRDVLGKLQDVADNLTKYAEQKGGKLNVEDIDDALNEVGPLTHRGAEESQALHSHIYHALSDTRDAMIKAIADNAKDPSLAKNLLAANAKYSKLIRVFPDIARAAANASTGQKNIAQMIGDFQNAIINRGGLAAATPSGTQVVGATKLGTSIFPKPEGNE